MKRLLYMLTFKIHSFAFKWEGSCNQSIIPSTPLYEKFVVIAMFCHKDKWRKDKQRLWDHSSCQHETDKVNSISVPYTTRLSPIPFLILTI